MIPVKFILVISKLFSIIKFCRLYKEIIVKVGIEIKKEIFADSSLLKFKNLAAVIVIPDLLTPGIKDKIWKKPTQSAELYLKSLLIFFFVTVKSLKYRRTPKIIVDQPIIS